MSAEIQLLALAAASQVFLDCHASLVALGIILPALSGRLLSSFFLCGCCAFSLRPRVVFSLQTLSESSGRPSGKDFSLRARGGSSDECMGVNVMIEVNALGEILRQPAPGRVGANALLRTVYGGD